MTENNNDKPRVYLFRRFLLTVVYITITVMLFVGLAYLATSDGCPSRNRCTESDQVIFAIIGLLDFVLAIILFFFGMKGWLPGTKQLRS